MIPIKPDEPLGPAPIASTQQSPQGMISEGMQAKAGVGMSLDQMRLYLIATFGPNWGPKMYDEIVKGIVMSALSQVRSSAERAKKAMRGTR